MNKPAAISRTEGARQSRARFTTGEFLRMADAGAFDDMKIELVHGELERMNPPMSMHAVTQTAVVVRLAQVVRSPFHVLTEVGLDLGGDTVRSCDAAIVRDVPTENRLLTAADVLLVVEVAETTIARDLGEKLADYAAAGVSHYWVVDRGAAVVHTYSAPRSSSYTEASIVRFGEPLPVPESDASITLG